MAKGLGIFLVLCGLLITGLAFYYPILPPIVYSQSQPYSQSHRSSLSLMAFTPSVSLPQSVLLDVPFYTHDAQYLYLNPEGLCRFASREMIIAYWVNKGYVSGGVPSQYTLFVEEKHGQFTETMYFESFTSRNLFVVDHSTVTQGFAEYYDNYLYMSASTDDEVTIAKTYLSLGVPLFGGVTVNDEGWPDENANFHIPNHVIVYTGYNATGFFFNNPISLNLTYPACGSGKFMPLSTFRNGISNPDCWILNAVFPSNYSPMFARATIRVSFCGVNIPYIDVYSIWEHVKTDFFGGATVTTLQTGSVITVNFAFPLTNYNTYSIYDPSGFIPIYPANNRQIWYWYSGYAPLTEPLTPHPWETIPSPPSPPPPEVPIPPSEPIPRNPVPVTVTIYSFPSELVVGPVVMIFGVALNKKKHR